MRTYKCEDNCGAELVISDDGTKGICPNCGREYFIVSLEVMPLKRRLLKIAGERNRKNTSRANDLKSLANEILNKDNDDVFAIFYLALAEKMFGNIAPFQKFVQETNYNALQNDFNKQILRDIVVEANARFKYDICNHIKRVVDDNALQNDYITRVDETIEAESKDSGNYFVVEKDIFICHASEDGQIAENIVDELKKNGLKSWISTRNIRPNSPDYWQDIKQGIKNCRIMLVLSSVNSMNSQDCCKEIGLAQNEDLFKLEYKLDKSQHNDVFEGYFESRQWIDGIENYKKGIGFLIATVKEMLEEAKLNKQRHRLEEERKEREKIAFERSIEEKTHQLEVAARACIAQNVASNFNSDSVAMIKAILNCLIENDLAGAKQFFGQSNILSEVINDIAQMSITLGQVQQTADIALKNTLWSKMKQQASTLKTYHAQISEEEKVLYISINNSEILAYLCILFSTINESERMQFVINYIKVTEIYDNNICKKLLIVLLKSNNIDKASDLLKYNIGLDGSFVLKTVLDYFDDSDLKALAIEDIIKKYTFDNDIAEMLNDYLLKGKDSVDIILLVIKLMAKNNISINTALLVDTAMYNKIDFDGIDIIFESLKGKSLTSLDVDNLISFAVKKNDSEVVNAVLGFLMDTCNIADIGSDNIKKIWESIDLFSGADRFLVYSKLCKLSMERKTKEEMVSYYFKNQNDDVVDRIAIANIFCQEPTKITLSSYEDYLMSKIDDETTKIEIVEKLVDITMFFSNIENFIKKYYENSLDSEKTKIKIVGLLTKNQMTFDENTSKNFLFMPQKSYNEGYFNIMKKYLDENCQSAFELLKAYIDNNAIDDGDKIIGLIVDTLANNFNIDALGYFIRYFSGDCERKERLLKKILIYQIKIKKLLIQYKIGQLDIVVNIAQAYAIFNNNEETSVKKVIDNLTKMGCSLDDKIICKNQKQKFLFKDILKLIDENLT